MFKDIEGKEVSIGDKVAAATVSYKRAHLRVGIVSNMNPETKTITIRFPEGKSPLWSKRSTITTNGSSNLFVIEKAVMP